MSFPSEGIYAIFYLFLNKHHILVKNTKETICFSALGTIVKCEHSALNRLRNGDII